MKCRKSVIVNGQLCPVFFGKNGVDNTKYDSSFSEGLDYVVDMLNQKLRILKRELWYNVNFGQPLVDKIKSKYILDSSIASVISKQNGVMSISNFRSQIINGEYSCTMTIVTNYGEAIISI